MALPAIENYTDEKLDDLLNACINEKERRAALATIPDQIAALRAKYVEGGGDPALLDPTGDPPT